MRKLKKLYYYLKMKLQGYSKDTIYTSLAFKKLITFEEYEKYIDNRIKKGGN